MARGAQLALLLAAVLCLGAHVAVSGASAAAHTSGVGAPHLRAVDDASLAHSQQRNGFAADVAAKQVEQRHLLGAGGDAGAQLPAQRRRALLAAPVVCDDVCQAQASLLMFAAIILLVCIMALSGICCLHALEGPSRFEVAKEGHNKDN